MTHGLTYLDRPSLTRPDPAGFEATRDTMSHVLRSNGRNKRMVALSSSLQ